MKKNIGVSLSPEVMEILDSRRGLVPRSAYIEMILRKDLNIPLLAHSEGLGSPEGGSN